MVRNYLKAASFYSYDATVDENPVMRWIGREVKRFVAEAHIHLPFLLRIAAAPPDLTADMAANGLPPPRPPALRHTAQATQLRACQCS